MNIAFVIITFNPSVNVLSKVLDSIIGQTDRIIIVDNCSDNLESWEKESSRDNVGLVKLEKNIGIAAASNVGAKYAKNYGANKIIFSDQDTIFPENFCDTLCKIVAKTSDCIFVPQFFDTVRQSVASFQDQERPLKDLIIGEEPTRVLHGIASGMCVDVDRFLELGGFDKDLFIDWVDFEFCWRAATQGTFTYCVPELIINHSLGDNSSQIFGRKYTLRSAFRHYFMTRNELYLAIHSEFTPSKLRIYMAYRSLRRAVIMPLIVRENNLRYFLYSVKGVLDGLRARVGPLVDD